MRQCFEIYKSSKPKFNYEIAFEGGKLQSVWHILLYMNLHYSLSSVTVKIGPTNAPGKDQKVFCSKKIRLQTIVEICMK